MGNLPSLFWFFMWHPNLLFTSCTGLPHATAVAGFKLFTVS